jgi:hypothetical protein
MDHFVSLTVRARRSLMERAPKAVAAMGVAAKGVAAMPVTRIKEG